MKCPFPQVLRLLSGLALLAIVLWFIVEFPIMRLELAAGFVAYALILWRWPKMWLIALPALLPVFDLAPWSGRYFFDEFDALVLLTVGILIFRKDGERALPPISRGTKCVLTLLALSYTLSASIRLWPPPAITLDAFANYYSPYNALRLFKGFAWAMLLYRPLRGAIAKDSNAGILLCCGFLFGLVGVCIIALYERALFPGLFNWNSDYRIASSFSSMHTGDGPIDVWLAATIPLIGILVVCRQWKALLPLTIGIGLLSFYTLVSAASRGPIIAIVIAFGVGMSVFLAMRSSLRRGIIVAALGLSAFTLILAIGLSFPSETFLWQRFTQTRQDATIRFEHWRHALNIRDDTFTTQLFGMGLGSFPVLHQERATSELRSAHYSFMTDANGAFLRLFSGQNLYMGQAVSVEPRRVYKVRLKVRTLESGASLIVNVCELWMLYSSNCTHNAFRQLPVSEEWQTISGTVHTIQTGSLKSISGLSLKPPTRLTFWISNAPLHGVDIGMIGLIDDEGQELIANGQFDQGADQWFWAVDDHLAWHAKNLVVHTLIEQGWFGLIALGAFFLLTLRSLVARIVEGDAFSVTLLAALTGLMVSTITVSTFDQPRLILMFYLLCFIALLRLSPVPNVVQRDRRTRGELQAALPQ